MHIKMAPAMLAPTLLRRLLAAGLLATSMAAPALEVGYLRLEREAGKPLRAEIPLTDRSPITANDLRARIAARETFEVAGLRYHPGLSKVQISARQLPQGKASLLIEGLPNDGPTLDLLLTVSDRSMLTIAEFRIDLRSMGNEFAPARAGSSLAAQQRQASPDKRPAAPASAAASPLTAPAAVTGAAPAPAQAAPPAPQARPQVTAAQPAVAPAPPPVATVAPAAVVRPAAPATQENPADIKASLTRAVQGWAQAWSRRDVKAYLDAYAPNFVSADRSLSTQEWAAQRRSRIESRKHIEVRIEDLEFDPKGADWVASFMQHYRSENFREATRKQLLMRQFDGRWLIVAEREDR